MESVCRVGLEDASLLARCRRVCELVSACCTITDRDDLLRPILEKNTPYLDATYCGQCLLSVPWCRCTTRGFGITPFLLCCRSNHSHVAQALIEAGANPYMITATQRYHRLNGLHLAAIHDAGDTIDVILSKTEGLLDSTADQGFTALHLAVIHGASRSVEALLRHGADKERKDLHGKTPLMHCMGQEGHDEVSRILEGSGAEGVQRGQGVLNQEWTERQSDVLSRLPTLGPVSGEFTPRVACPLLTPRGGLLGGPSGASLLAMEKSLGAPDSLGMVTPRGARSLRPMVARLPTEEKREEVSASVPMIRKEEMPPPRRIPKAGRGLPMRQSVAVVVEEKEEEEEEMKGTIGKGRDVHNEDEKKTVDDDDDDEDDREDSPKSVASQGSEESSSSSGTTGTQGTTSTSSEEEVFDRSSIKAKSSQVVGQATARLLESHSNASSPTSEAQADRYGKGKTSASEAGSDYSGEDSVDSEDDGEAICFNRKATGVTKQATAEEEKWAAELTEGNEVFTDMDEEMKEMEAALLAAKTRSEGMRMQAAALRANGAKQDQRLGLSPSPEKAAISVPKLNLAGLGGTSPGASLGMGKLGKILSKAQEKQEKALSSPRSSRGGHKKSQKKSALSLDFELPTIQQASGEDSESDDDDAEPLSRADLLALGALTARTMNQEEEREKALRRKGGPIKLRSESNWNEVSTPKSNGGAMMQPATARPSYGYSSSGCGSGGLSGGMQKPFQEKKGDDLDDLLADLDV